MVDSIKSQLQTYLESHYPTVFNGGELEWMIFNTDKGFPAKPSNISRRLRELAEAEEINKSEKNGSVWYQARHGRELNGVPIFRKVEVKQLKLI